MKLFFYFITIALISSCSLNETKEKPEYIQEKPTNTASSNTGIHKEYYPNGQLRITGELNNDGKKEGTWTSYFENGKKNSESVFKDGINNGYSMVWYPNGNIRYFGDYLEGRRSGSWTFYNEEGEVTKKESY